MGAVQIQRRNQNRTQVRVLDAPSGGATQLDDYTLHEVLGSGGSAVVYRATHASDPDRAVALKLLKPQGSQGADQLLHELRVLQALEHPGVVQVLDFGRSGEGALWMAFEYVPGVQLRHVLQTDTPMPFSRAKPLMVQLLDALAAAHDKQIVHLDLKPGNVMVTRTPEGDERIKLLDFGLARRMDRLSDWNQTPAGDSVGTPRYMAPELLLACDQPLDDSAPVGPFCDVYAAGLIFFELLTGQPAMVGACAHEVIVKQMVQPLRWPAWLENPELNMLLEATTHKDWRKRVPDAATFLEALDLIDLPDVLASNTKTSQRAKSQPLDRFVLPNTHTPTHTHTQNPKTLTAAASDAPTQQPPQTHTSEPAASPLRLTRLVPRFMRPRRLVPLALLPVAPASAEVIEPTEAPTTTPAEVSAPEPTTQPAPADTSASLNIPASADAAPTAETQAAPSNTSPHTPPPASWVARWSQPLKHPPLFVPMLLSLSALLLTLGLFL